MKNRAVIVIMAVLPFMCGVGPHVATAAAANRAACGSSLETWFAP